MKRKFLVAFTAVLTVTIVSLIYTTSNLTGLKRPKASESEKSIVVVNYEPPNCKNSSNDDDKPKTKNDEKEKTKKPPIDFLKTYPSLLSCKHNINQWRPGDKIEPADASFDFTQPADSKFHNERILRAVIVYFPIGSVTYYRNEFKWLYRSWIHMLKFEPPKWRTDLIVFIERDEAMFKASDFFLNEMNCRFENLRRTAEDKPMCTLINYVALKKRSMDTPERTWPSLDEKYEHMLRNIDIFKTPNTEQLDPFYKLLRQSLTEYGYLDSILMAFEG